MLNMLSKHDPFKYFPVEAYLKGETAQISKKDLHEGKYQPLISEG